MKFESYPFEKLRTLLAPLTAPKERPLLELTVGEPQFETPSFIQEALAQNSALLKKYPKSAGESYLKEAQLHFIERRYNLKLELSELIPTFGTREVLFTLPQYLLFDKPSPVMAHPNPFYQIYEGAAIASRARTLYMELNASNGFTPSLTKEEMRECDLVILNSPNNPTGRTLNLEELGVWVKHALEFDFILINDECYGDIYAHTPAPSILEASAAVGNQSFKNILAINSISKRSSAPGLRSGYIAGDASILKGYGEYRTYVGCAIPLPLQKAAALAWEDGEHAEAIRSKYAQNLKLAQEILGIPVEPWSFYAWLFVGDDIAFTQKLYQEEGVVVLPGSFLGRQGAGQGYVRLALVHEPSTLQNALLKVVSCLKR